jgi:misacylated tRNA(Ala) deacylase
MSAQSDTTVVLYASDAELAEFITTVQAVDAEQHAVVLDRTAFYPGGGGQPADTGVLSDSPGREWPLTGLRKDGARLLHLLDQSATPLPDVGAQLTGKVDWVRRYKLMRTHTALHILCGVVFRDYGARVTGGNMDVDKARMDFELSEFGPERAAEIERRANAEIEARREIRVMTLPREEAFAIPDLIRTKINLLPEGIEEVRIVEIVGLDLQADGGTHVSNTGQVGGIEVVGTRSKGKNNKRLEIVLTDEPFSR